MLLLLTESAAQNVHLHWPVHRPQFVVQQHCPHQLQSSRGEAPAGTVCILWDLLSIILVLIYFATVAVCGLFMFLKKWLKHT